MVPDQCPSRDEILGHRDPESGKTVHLPERKLDQHLGGAQLTDDRRAEEGRAVHAGIGEQVVEFPGRVASLMQVGPIDRRRGARRAQVATRDRSARTGSKAGLHRLADILQVGKGHRGGRRRQARAVRSARQRALGEHERRRRARQRRVGALVVGLHGGDRLQLDLAAGCTLTCTRSSILSMPEVPSAANFVVIRLPLAPTAVSTPPSAARNPASDASTWVAVMLAFSLAMLVARSIGLPLLESVAAIAFVNGVTLVVPPPALACTLTRESSAVPTTPRATTTNGEVIPVTSAA